VAVVLPKSRAEIAGLAAGDVLVEVNGKPVATLDAVRDILLTVREKASLALVVRRGNDRLSFLLQGPEGL
jgi:S1-C subfamily serine protease